MDEKHENFLLRWSRLKRRLPASPEAAQTTTSPSPSSLPAPAKEPLPALDSLTISSDFTVFMQDEVDASMRRAALQQLFHEDHFNVMDGLDVYVDDYNQFEPISAELLAKLQQARGLLFDETPAPATAESDQVIAPSEAEPSSDSNASSATISNAKEAPE